ncbi:MAG: helix-turn-helix domain-containing protein [Actinomycetota bacterium]|nr:helix-turn-helix domain-containing protein [Actinomycetota bacterium]
MAREPENLAEMRRGLGAQLAVFRAAAELTQGQLARAAFCDRTNVAHIEKGRSRGDERFWTIADELCGADGALLAAFRAVTTVKQAHEVQLREAQLAECRAKAQALRLTLRREVDRLGIATPAGTVDRDPRPGTVEDQDMKRREAIALAAKMAVGAGLTTADRAILDAPVTASPVPARIGAPDVVRVEAMTRSLMAQDRALGGGSCRDAVLGHLNWAQQLRAASASDDVRRALEAALARLENLAGWTSDDLCLPRSAQRYYLRSLESARRAEEPALAAHALGCLGWQYLQAGHFPEALQLLRLGALPAQEAASPGMLADLVRMEAHAHAGLGNAGEAQRALHRAEEHYARVHKAPDRLIGTVVLPDHSELPAARGNTYSRLASHDRHFAEAAAMNMIEALTLRDPGRTRAMLLGRVTLATNQYRCGETDLANSTTELVLASIGQVSSRRTTRDLITLGAEIRQHTTDSTALDLAHRITTEIAA